MFVFVRSWLPSRGVTGASPVDACMVTWPGACNGVVPVADRSADGCGAVVAGCSVPVHGLHRQSVRLWGVHVRLGKVFLCGRGGTRTWPMGGFGVGQLVIR